MGCNDSQTAIDDAISHLEELINTSAVSVTTDGEQITYDLSQAQRRLNQLQQQSPTAMSCSRTRPRMWRGIYGTDYA